MDEKILKDLKEHTHKTIGQHVIEMYNNKPETTNVVEKMSAHLGNWDDIMNGCFQVGKKGLPGKDFYIVILVKAEAIFHNKVLHTIPFVQPVCPSPEYDQTVFKYHHLSGTVEFLWTLPDKLTYDWYVENTPLVTSDRWPLLKFVLKDKNGELLKQAKILNGETWLEEVRPEI